MRVDDTASVTVRRAGPADIVTLAALCAEHATHERLAHEPHQRMDALAAALQGDTPRLFAWLAIVDGNAVGYASATRDFSTLDRADYLHMDCLYVASAWRGRSIGALLWNALQRHARQLGCRTIQWQTPTWNTGAARFYRRLGAREMFKRRYAFPLQPGA